MTFVIETPIQRPRHGGRQHEPTNVTVELRSNEGFLDTVLDNPTRVHYNSRNKLHVVTAVNSSYGRDHDEASYGVANVSLGLQALHQCFAAHMPFSLSPDWVWYMIVHEVAEHVRQNSDRYAAAFTRTPSQKQTIEVRDDSLRYDAPSDWMRSINLIREPLAAKVTDRTMQLFLPAFSTTTIEDETAVLVAFMDVVSSYYEFEWRTMCGIPQIRLEGTAEDWDTLYSMTDRLSIEFPGLRAYFENLLPVLEKIHATASAHQVDENFWRSIYKYGGGSGGPFINGWFTAFFAHTQTQQGAKLREDFDWGRMMEHSFSGFSTNDFPAHLSQVPFKWNYYGTMYDMTFAAGITGVTTDDGFMSPRLGFAVVEN
ncbi:MAG TPA: DUF4419 domain-containing protein [Verrucomicrobiae bacterium]|nr:DUF4419 domain-containing protein [Verrucomicrobiae bacterium]